MKFVYHPAGKIKFRGFVQKGNSHHSLKTAKKIKFGGEVKDKRFFSFASNGKIKLKIKILAIKKTPNKNPTKPNNTIRKHVRKEKNLESLRKFRLNFVH